MHIMHLMQSIIVPLLTFTRSPLTARAIVRKHGRAVVTRYGRPFATLVATSTTSAKLQIAMEVTSDNLNRKRSGVMAEIEAGRCVRVTWRGEGVMDLVPVEVP